MKYFTFILVLFTASMGSSQSLPIDFETEITTENFVDFDGGSATVIPNPQSNGINTSETVAQIVRDGGEIWAGSKIELANNLDFTTLNIISMKVFTTAPVGTTVKFKLEGAEAAERDVQTTVTNEWEVLTWDFTGTPNNLNNVVFMFDFGNVGDGAVNSTFLFDDVEQLFGGMQIDFPVDFEGESVNYSMTDFGGNVSSLITDPTDFNNNVIEVIKTDEAALWAGTTIGTNAGFATNLPLSLTDSKMNVRVWSPEAGTPIRLKVERSGDPTQTCETETNTTVSGEWEVIEFDFANEAPGTAALEFGLTNGWTYNMASIFFNFGAEGAVVGEKTYYFDDVKFGGIPTSVSDLTASDLSVFPNPTSHQWTISSDNSIISSIQVYDVRGTLIINKSGNDNTMWIDASGLAPGMYSSRITTTEGVSTIKLLRQ